MKNPRSQPAPRADGGLRGVGIPYTEVGGRLVVSYVTELWGEPPLEQLVAVTVWRSATGWPGESRWDRMLMKWRDFRSSFSFRSPLRADDDMPVGWVDGGQARAWTRYHPRRRVVRVLGRSYPVPSDRRALLVLIDRADGVGGRPVVTTRTVPCEPRALGEEMWPQLEVWRRVVRDDPVAGAFIAEGERE